MKFDESTDLRPRRASQENRQMGTILLSCSLAIQFLATIQAFRMMWASRRLAWLLVACAIFLMTVRRSITLSSALLLGKNPDPIAESVALIISILMLTGLLGLYTGLRVRAVAGTTAEDGARNGPTHLNRLTQTALLLVVITLFGSLFVGYNSYTVSQERVLERMLDRGLQMARTVRDIGGRETARRMDSIGREGLAEIRRIWGALAAQQPGAYLCVIGSDGRVLEHTRRPEAIGKYAGDAVLPGKNGAEPKHLRALLNEKTDWTGEHIAFTGDPTIVAFTYSPVLDALIGVHIPRKEVERETRSAVLPWIGGVVLIVVVLVPLSSVLMYSAYVSSQRMSLEANTALQKSERRVRLLLDSTAEAIYGLDLDGNCTFANPACAELLGYAGPPELIGKNMHELAHHARPDGTPYPPDQCPILQTIRANKPTYVDNEVLWRADGTSFPAEYRSHPVRRNGRTVGSVVTFLDITERKRAEEALRKSEQMLLRAQEIAHLGSWELDLEKNKLTWSDEVYRIFGLQPQEFGATYEAFLAAVHPEDRGTVDEAYSTSVKTGEPYEVVHRVVRPGGEIRVVHEKCEHAIDERGIVIRSIGTVLDVTERKVAEDALEARARQQAVIADLGHYALVTENLTDLMNEVVRRLAATLDVEFCKVLKLLADKTGLLLRAGVGWKAGLVGTAVVGTDANSQAGFTLDSGAPVIVDDLRTESRFSGPPLLRDHNVVSGMSVIIGGSEHPWGVLGAHSTRRRAFNQDDVNFLQAAANLLADAIARKRAENEVRKLNLELEHRVEQRTAELQATNRELEAFSYSVSHDLRAPLRHISGYAGILHDEHAGELGLEARDHVKTIRCSVGKMEVLIEDLLTFSRLGRKELTKTIVDCDRLVRETWNEIASRRDVQRVPVHIGALPRALADSALLRQVWTNLLDNAVKYSSSRATPEITVDSYGSNGTTWYRIRDNGVGFDPLYADKLFDVFQRLHGDNEFPGTGIGLAIVQRIIHRHGGVIKGTGQVDNGACFEFTLGA